MSLDRNFRTLVARRLLDGESLPALTKRRAEAAGYRAFQPIEAFLNFMDPTFRHRPKAREEEALEALGIIAAPPDSPIVESLYRSSFLDELRAEQTKSGTAFRRLSIEDERSRLIGPNGLNSAFAEGEQVLRQEAAQAAPEHSLLKERLALNRFRVMLNRNMEAHGFNRAAALEKNAHLAYQRQLQLAVLTFVFDTRRPLQHRFLISPTATDSFDIFSRRDAIEIGLQSTSFALMAGGRPYLTPNDHAECDWSVKLLCLATSLVAERLTP